MTTYVSSLEQDLERQDGRLQLMQSNGGTMSASEAVITPLLTLHSGPVGGSSPAQCGRRARPAEHHHHRHGRHDARRRRRPRRRPAERDQRRATVRVLHPDPRRARGRRGWGLIAFDPVAGALSVGPESAGSRPGPVCYGRGGTDADRDRRRPSCSGFSIPTTSSAARWSSTSRAPGTLSPQPGEPLGLDAEETAIAATSASSTTRWPTRSAWSACNKGLDPREFSLYRLRRGRRRPRRPRSRASSAARADGRAAR